MDLRTTVWKPISGASNSERERLEIYNQIMDTIEDPCDSNQYIIDNRIGSESNYGRVYQITTLNGMKIAGKILPIFSKIDEDKNVKEINIAILASNCVRELKTTHFPLVYASSLCENAIFNEEDIYYQLSAVYQLSKKLPNKLQIGRYRKNNFRKYSEAKSYVEQIIGPFDDSDIRIKTNVLLSELAWGDLAQYLKGQGNNLKIEENNLNKMYEVILQSIYDMQKYLNVVHGDLHTGNLLLSAFENQATILVHDFGESQIIDEFTVQDRLFDIGNITDKLIEHHFPIETPFGEKLFIMKRYIETLREESTDNTIEILDDVRTYWTNLF